MINDMRHYWLPRRMKYKQPQQRKGVCQTRFATEPEGVLPGEDGVIPIAEIAQDTGETPTIAYLRGKVDKIIPEN